MTTIYQPDKQTRLVRKWHLFDGVTFHLQRLNARGKWKTSVWCQETIFYETIGDYWYFLLYKERQRKGETLKAS